MPAQTKAPHGPCVSSEPPHGVPRPKESPHGTPPPRHAISGAILRSTRSHQPPQEPPCIPTPRSSDMVTPVQVTAVEQVSRASVLPLQCGCQFHDSATLRRAAPSLEAIDHLASNAEARANLWDNIRLRNINIALSRVGLVLPAASPATANGTPLLNKALQRVLSDFVRRSHISLPQFVELMCGQTTDDYRPNKRMLPDVIRNACGDYPHLDALLSIVESGVRAPLRHDPSPQRTYPASHKSAEERYSVLVKNIRKEQDQWRCFVLDLDILKLWPEVRISPFGVVDKGDADPRTTGRVIHDLSFPAGTSVNDATDTASICTPLFEPCDAIAAEIIRQQQQHPDAEIQLQAGDVASAFRNVCTHSESAYMFAGRLERDNALVIDTSAAFGWSGSPVSYGVVGGAIAHLHGNSINSYRAPGPFNYYWVDDHINVAANIGANCGEVERSLRSAMITMLGHGAINEDKFTSWSSRQQILGLVFDSIAGTVAMPDDKIQKAWDCVRSALAADFLTRSVYRSLLGRLRHVAACVRPARPFLQRLCQQERHLHRWQRVPVSTAMKEDLKWWSTILDPPILNGVPLTYFHSRPAPDVIVAMDASDFAICTLVAADKAFLRYSFSADERRLILATKATPSVGFDINYRELLSCALAVHAWGPSWSSRRRDWLGPPVHVQFQIDNTSAVAWQNKMASRNHRAQTIIRLLGLWELEFGLSFSATHVAGVDNRIADAGSRSTSHASNGRVEIGSDMAFYLRVHSVAAPTFSKYRGALKAWYAWSTLRGIQPALLGYPVEAKLQFITDFVLHGFQHGYGSGHPIKGSSIAAVLHGIMHLFRAAALDFPSDHPQIRMVLKGIYRLDAPVTHKAPVTLRMLELCYRSLDLTMPSDQALWGVLCLSFFFLLRRSEIASKGKKFACFALKAVDIAVLNSRDSVTSSAREAESVHIRLSGSKTNQRGAPTLRMLNRSGHPFLCPVFGALCLLKARRNLPLEIPAAVFINRNSRPECVSESSVAMAI